MMKQERKVKQLSAALESFEQTLETLHVEQALLKELLFLANRAQAYLKKGDHKASDTLLSTALLTIKRNLGTELSLRDAFTLSSILVEDLRVHISDPAVLIADASDFAGGFFDVYSAQEHHREHLPKYLEQRPFPKGYKDAAKSIIAVLRSFELPKEQSRLLINCVRRIEKQAIVFSKRPVKDADLAAQSLLITTLYFDMLDMQGVYLTQHQVLTIMGMVVFAVPAWLCAAPPAWLVQAAIVLVGLIVWGISEGMSYASTKKAYKNLWIYIEDCKKTVTAAVRELNREVTGMSADEKADVKKALEETLDKVTTKELKVKRKSKIQQKLRAMIAAL